MLNLESRVSYCNIFNLLVITWKINIAVHLDSSVSTKINATYYFSFSSFFTIIKELTVSTITV